ncbi:MAG: hypothetical protein Q8Q02_04070 [Nocardioides sp.]|nr:hypothetical protein [Nocardioides sp.]
MSRVRSSSVIVTVTVVAAPPCTGSHVGSAVSRKAQNARPSTSSWEIRRPVAGSVVAPAVPPEMSSMHRL